MVPLIWVIAGIVLLVGEVLAGEFVLAMLGVAALAAGGSAALGLGWVGSALVFALTSVVLLLTARPALKRKAQKAVEGYQQHSERMAGRSAVVSQRVDGHGGRVRIGPDEWSARAFVDGEVMEPDERVTVVRIEGATALVMAE
jgi:membrane protein implicated in regulation of membrane protease activity